MKRHKSPQTLLAAHQEPRRPLRPLNSATSSCRDAKQHLCPGDDRSGLARAGRARRDGPVSGKLRRVPQQWDG
ncbi:hypothetical protein BHM03_00016008 [Ensete ventricosum]|nr:hypothetical protein BHM03_00016008 [Ensete ventricosum]